MVESKVGVSPYHQIAVIYCRDVQGNLQGTFGRCSHAFQASWESPNQKLKSLILYSLAAIYTTDIFPAPAFKHIECKGAIFSGLLTDSTAGDPTASTGVYEYKSPGKDQIRGLITLQRGADTGKAFLPWFIKLVLTTSRLDLCGIPAVVSERTLSFAHQVTEVFSKHLRNIAHGDLWNVGGKCYFENGILFYTARNAIIEMILPAFPCKSTCLDKVSGTTPDKGEELTLRSIHKFIQEAEKVYPPGVKFFIVSDGHVFSDCIGADDITVDNYGEKLVEMRDELFGVDSGKKIPFMGLHALFHLDDEHMSLSAEVISKVEVPVYIDTVHTTEANKCRQLLTAGSGIDGTALRKKIETSDSSALALYRGFSKFMCEDLAFHPTMRATSKSKQKKIAAKVAFEMLKRNQAYSNLVEVLFPVHVRLSIHAHPNSGPKFGINLLGQSGCRTTISLLEDIPEMSDDLLHIPTPWHNSVIKIVGKDGWFVVKARIVKEGVEAGICTAEIIEGKDGCGTYTLVTMKNLKPLETDSLKCALESVEQVGIRPLTKILELGEVEY